MRSWVKLVVISGLLSIFGYFLVLKNAWTIPNLPPVEGVSKLPSEPQKLIEKMSLESSEIDWSSVDVYGLPLPTVDTKSINVITVVINAKVNSNGFIEISYREAEVPNGVPKTGRHLLFLHGRSFTSETWEELGTLQFLAALGHHAVAIDLPGYGDSAADSVIKKDIFLSSVIEMLHLQSPILISPSMSGTYSVGFVAKEWRKLSGYIPIAAVETGSVPQSELEKVQLPTIILYGDKDRSGLAEDCVKHLKVMPKSRTVVFMGAGHPCYLNEPELFNQLLHNFIHLTNKK